MWEWVLVFVAMFALDFVWTFYTKAVTARRAFASANWAVAILAFNAVAQIGYVNNWWLTIPAALGAFCGTYAAMRVHSIRD